MTGRSSPYVLFDGTARGDGGPSRLYEGAVRQIVAWEPQAVQPALGELEAALGQGFHAAGFLSYEAGWDIAGFRRPLRAGRSPGDAPLLWFGLFPAVKLLTADQIAALLPPAHGAGIGRIVPAIDRDEYARMLGAVKAYLAAGDIYQANLTFPCSVELRGDRRSIFATVSARAKAGYSALIETGSHDILSFSPELFFTLDGRHIEARPMKGTAMRDPDAAIDRQAAETLRTDPKQRAENLMIVDLIRNDLSRVAVPGSVEVPALFDIETYPSVHQMTSRVTARLQAGIGPIEALLALFPCGSITGAPKRRAMEIIDELEVAARGGYTGAIGYIDPAGSATFSVAIRTVVAARGCSIGTLGLGSGLVADSVMESEWAECLGKAAFLGGTMQADERRQPVPPLAVRYAVGVTPR